MQVHLNTSLKMLIHNSILLQDFPEKIREEFHNSSRSYLNLNRLSEEPEEHIFY